MKNIESTEFQINLKKYLKEAAASDDVYLIKTPDGNVVLMSEQQYNGLKERLLKLTEQK